MVAGKFTVKLELREIQSNVLILVELDLKNIDNALWSILGGQRGFHFTW